MLGLRSWVGLGVPTVEGLRVIRLLGFKDRRVQNFPNLDPVNPLTPPPPPKPQVWVRCSHLGVKILMALATYYLTISPIGPRKGSPRVGFKVEGLGFGV